MTTLRLLRGEKRKDRYLQMTHFVRGDDNAAESAGVFDDSDRINFFETLIHDARSADVRESCAEMFA